MFTSSKKLMSAASNLERAKLQHYVLNKPIGETPPGAQNAIFGLGCFWGAERKFWQQKGVITTAVGYCGGDFPFPAYENICTGSTKHIEVVRVVFDPKQTEYKDLLHVFWANHDPTQLNKQGNDIGSQYRSALFYFNEEQKRLAENTMENFQFQLYKNNYGKIVTDILDANEHPFYFAEDYHQQYLAKNPAGYCGLRGTGCYVPK